MTLLLPEPGEEQQRHLKLPSYIHDESLDRAQVQGWKSICMRAQSTATGVKHLKSLLIFPDFFFEGNAVDF